jgi:hypothetical protein
MGARHYQLPMRRRDGSMARYGEHRGFYDHLRQSFGSTEPVSCRHCKATGGCSCGQESAGLVFDAARELALPTGSAAADREARDFRKALVVSPYNRAQIQVLRSALESLLSWHKLTPEHARDVAKIERVTSLILASRAAESDLP